LSEYLFEIPVLVQNFKHKNVRNYTANQVNKFSHDTFNKTYPQICIVCSFGVFEVNSARHETVDSVDHVNGRRKEEVGPGSRS